MVKAETLSKLALKVVEKLIVAGILYLLALLSGLRLN